MEVVCLQRRIAGCQSDYVRGELSQILGPQEFNLPTRRFLLTVLIRLLFKCARYHLASNRLRTQAAARAGLRTAASGDTALQCLRFDCMTVSAMMVLSNAGDKG